MGASERLKAYLANKKISQAVFAKSIGASTGYVNALSRSFGSKYESIVKELYPDLNIAWIITGEGNMFNSSTDDSDKSNITASYPIPIYNLDAVAGMHTPNDVTDMDPYVERWIQFPGAKEGDIAFPVSSDSMTPRYLPGSILQVRKVERWREYFGYGSNFVLFLVDGRRLLKEIQKSQEDPQAQVLCVSCNSKYPPEELPKSLIADVYKVIKSLSDEGF